MESPNKRKRSKIVFQVLLVLIIGKSVFAVEIGSEILQNPSSILVTSLQNSTEESESSANRLDRLEEKVSKLTEKISLLERRNTDFSNLEEKLESNNKAKKQEAAQLRVTRLEMSYLEGHQFSGNRIRRGTQQVLNSTAIPCTIRACAFDFKSTKGQKDVNKKMPASCNDLFDLGHVLNGFYPVLKEGKFELIFCNFRKGAAETRIGFIDVKSSPVYFFVQKTGEEYGTLNTPMPYEIEVTNLGKAIDTKAGIFIAANAGVYFFAFSGVKYWNGGETSVSLQLNGKAVATSHGTRPVEGGLTMTLHSTLKLKKGDKISLVLTDGKITCFSPFTNFVGWLMEEEDIFNSN